MLPRIARLGMTLLLCAAPTLGECWGDEGHEVIARLADHYLQPGVRRRVAEMLAGDSSGLTPDTGIAAEATWADKYRDSDRTTTRVRYAGTGPWHYVDLEIDAPDLDAACFGHPPITPGAEASAGPAADCILDKIAEFSDELHRPVTSPEERRRALQFLLHLVGDLHQPLHVADHRDQGGNAVRVAWAPGGTGNLHHYWDTETVRNLGANAEDLAARLQAGISPAQRRAWSAGTPVDWAWQTFAIGKEHAYGRLPARPVQAVPIQAVPIQAVPIQALPLELDAAYAADAADTTALQLQRAGVRLARILNDALR